ncbi:flagellar biosynthesis anti-sigma factor FlgM [Noviherbaspirillum cavernae]|uniref:Negative regulator of flagellin synthesis n=1 Tax=Noviherbaspirillum cavernae TaxID=2320862 RepID=A0A418WVK4_9BURK|nr:flagellar biosynthesis anti-sigma factor FlgM [Noviherbaspirillum cavernae]RJF96697.1 flagellar biosynthesis anti-sigma factor FlgM [Noviherbaspirillum cavernae]
MKISTGTGPSPIAGTSQITETAAGEPVAPAASAASAASTSASGGALQSAVLQPALTALREMPDIDQAKVAALREALAKGEMPFNAAKLAGLIERFHRSKP